MRTDRFATRVSVALGDAGLKAFGKLNVPIYRASRGRLGGTVGGSPVLLLNTIGRRSGQRRTAPVLYMQDGESFVVIGSNAGNERVPAWALNLKASPDADIELRGRRQPVKARVAEGEERADLWRRFNERYRGFDDYDARTKRDIAVFVLEPQARD